MLPLLKAKQINLLLQSWSWLARDEQRPPPEPWQIWLFMAGRGAGKTRTGAEYTRYKIRTNKVESQDQLGVTGRGI